jgi:hypothetical protein
VHCDALAAICKGITQVSCFESCSKLAVDLQVGVTDEAEKTRIEEYFKTIQVSDGRWDWTMWCQSQIVWAPGVAIQYLIEVVFLLTDHFVGASCPPKKWV